MVCEPVGGLLGWSEVLGLELRPEGHALRLNAPELGEFLPTSGERSGIIGEQAQALEAVPAERDAEAKARHCATPAIRRLRPAAHP